MVDCLPVVHIPPRRELVDMAWIERKTRSDGGTSAIVRWRLGGSRTGRMQTETFGAGSDDQDLARAEGFKRTRERTGSVTIHCVLEPTVLARGASGGRAGFDVIYENVGGRHQ
jgi:hypothetical protein